PEALSGLHLVAVSSLQLPSELCSNISKTAATNAVPSYNAEISPAATRGMLSGSIMMFTALGNLRAQACLKGWMIPTTMQLITAVGLLALVPFTQESPRWLMTKGRKQESLPGLN
ncbi:putative quinate permease, partial [Tolypocladium ophioglossoides CBS 100239]